MAFYKSGNPVLSQDTFSGLFSSNASDRMTIQGTANKTAILLAITIAFSSISWYYPNAFFMWTGVIVGLILALIVTFKKTTAPYLAPAYAVFEGLFLGAISSLYNQLYEGIVLQAVLLTFCTFTALLLLYKSRMIKVTENFKLIISAATMGIGFAYLLSLVLSMFNINMGLGSNGLFGIGFSVVVVAVAAFNLVMDFDFIEEGEKQGAPKFMEWYAAFGLMVTIIWLYLEILRLLAKLRSRD
ncbi:MAG: Bax inhibitor-1/YccA family protein [Cytophagaceae bacterium]|jgi:uncharacterized YccA/Bax inhibitor family protein|nr:Bax inhibitor-1/YccA family protein [Cytophagaceae bacterium]